MTPSPTGGVDFSDPNNNPIAKFSSIGSFTNIMVPFMMIVGSLVALAMLLLGAYRYLTSEGNAEKIAKAQSVIIYAILGLFLIVASFILTRVIGTVLGVKMPFNI